MLHSRKFQIYTLLAVEENKVFISKEEIMIFYTSEHKTIVSAPVCAYEDRDLSFALTVCSLIEERFLHIENFEIAEDYSIHCEFSAAQESLPAGCDILDALRDCKLHVFAVDNPRPEEGWRKFVQASNPENVLWVNNRTVGRYERSVASVRGWVIGKSPVTLCITTGQREK